MINIPIYAVISGVTALVAIGFIIGAYGSRFITRKEFKESIDRLHDRIDEVLKKIQDICLKLVAMKGAENER